MKEGAERMEEPDNRAECREMLSSRQDVLVTRLHSQHLWFLTEDLHKIQLVPRAPSLMEELLAIDGSWGRESHFFLWKMAADRLFMPKWIPLHPCTYGEH